MRGLRIPALKKYQGRNPNGYFQDLPFEEQQRARVWLARLCKQGRERRGSVDQWLFAIYVGQARRLTLNPPTTSWSRRMNGKKGGYAVQRMYRCEGRNPTEKATSVRVIKQKLEREAERREQMGLPPKVRHAFLSTGR